MTIVRNPTLVPAHDKTGSAAFFARVKAEGIACDSGPRSRTDGRINRRRGGRGVYFGGPNGHVLEILTA
ncbi:MAG TPA: hypothetical protein VG651_09695 [Stellaceae bacterium]|nr:hypothetical protein [Stellaceae bacterium]